MPRRLRARQSVRRGKRSARRATGQSASEQGQRSCCTPERPDIAGFTFQSTLLRLAQPEEELACRDRDRTVAERPRSTFCPHPFCIYKTMNCELQTHDSIDLVAGRVTVREATRAAPPSRARSLGGSRVQGSAPRAEAVPMQKGECGRNAAAAKEAEQPYFAPSFLSPAWCPRHTFIKRI